jgi:predicted alpha/beta hydrolase family esterase
MRRAIILHGKPSQERYENPDIPKPHVANWLPWVGKKLTQSGVFVSIPAFPKPYYPVYKDWKYVFESETINKYTGLIGHSTGADFILRWLSENKDVSIERAVLIAPWHDTTGKYGKFSDYELDTSLANRIGKLTIFNSLDDSAAIQANVQRLMDEIPETRLVQFTNFGHFMLGNNMQTNEFPEILDELEIH